MWIIYNSDNSQNTWAITLRHPDENGDGWDVVRGLTQDQANRICKAHNGAIKCPVPNPFQCDQCGKEITSWTTHGEIILCDDKCKEDWIAEAGAEEAANCGPKDES
ncbi:MAG: hypothetical protein COB09_16945 [Thalassobium sp.]|nr:MAG: hypothetical protein COB09_16945 [Thalassobium sp.]